MFNDSESALISELLNSVITEEEVDHALTNLKKGKSPGLDGLPIDIFINCKKVLLPSVLQLLNYVLENGVYPSKWAEGLIDPQEYVSLLIGLYKNNGSVSCVVIYFFFIRPVYLTRTQLVEARFTRNKKEYLSLLNCEKSIILL